MKLYQIVEKSEELSHAGTKATADIADIALGLGFTQVPVRMISTKDGFAAKGQRQIQYFLDWNTCYRTIEENSIVLLQHPFHHKQLTRERTLRKLKEKKRVKFISLVHDVEQLRGFRDSAYYRAEFQSMLALADMLIVHNDSMKKWFIEQGVREERLVSLEIFDYLQDPGPMNMPAFRRSITVAGNLDTEKSGYIAGLGKIDGVEVDLYGPNFREASVKGGSVSYRGVYPANEIPAHLQSGFGLVWDGSGIEKCDGPAGEYLRYNNPHKLSLFLSSGLPVVIWSEAAESEFVRKHRLGICVEDLRELTQIMNNLTEEEYADYSKNVSEVRRDLLAGTHTVRALNTSLDRIRKDYDKQR